MITKIQTYINETVDEYGKYENMYIKIDKKYEFDLWNIGESDLIKIKEYLNNNFGFVERGLNIHDNVRVLFKNLPDIHRLKGEKTFLMMAYHIEEYAPSVEELGKKILKNKYKI